MEEHKRLGEEVIASGTLEPGIGPWNSSDFMVQKRRRGNFVWLKISTLLTKSRTKIEIHYPVSPKFSKTGRVSYLEPVGINGWISPDANRSE